MVIDRGRRKACRFPSVVRTIGRVPARSGHLSASRYTEHGRAFWEGGLSERMDDTEKDETT